MSAFTINFSANYITPFLAFDAQETNDDPTFGDILTLTSGNSISNSGGAFGLSAGDDVILAGSASASSTLILIAGQADLDGAGAVTQTGGTITAVSAIVRSIGPAVLTQAGNNVGTLAASVTAGGFTYVDANAVTIGDVSDPIYTGQPTSGVSATGAVSISTGNGTITLASTGGTESISGIAGVTLNAVGATSDVVATVDLDALTSSAGDITVTAGQDILFGTIASNADNDVRASRSITLDAGRDVILAGFSDFASDGFGNATGGGVTVTAGRDISISSANGDDASLGSSGAGNVTLTTGANGTLTVSAGSSNAVFSTSGRVIANADRVAIAVLSGIGASAGAVEILPVTAGRAVDLGSATDAAAATLEVSDAELDRVFAPVLRIGSASAGDITVSAAITAANYTTLSLRTGGAIVDGFAGTDLTVASLALRAVGGIGAGLALGSIETSVTNLAFTNTGGNVAIANTGALTIGAVDGLASSSNTGGGTTTISAASPLTFAVGTSTAGSATYTAGETADAPTRADDLTINAGVTVSVTAGDLTLRAGDDVILLAGAQATASGSVTVTAAFNDLDTGGGIDSTGTVEGSAVTFTAPGDIRVGTVTVTGGGLATVTTSGGAIVDSQPALGADITAGTIALSASTGIGTSADALEVSASTLEAGSDTGGIFLAATGPVTVGGVNGTLQGLRSATSGNIVLVAQGTITLADTTGTQTVAGGTTSGDVTLTAVGATADVTSTVDKDAITAAAGSIFVTAGQDILLGTVAAGADNDVLADGAITLDAGRDVTIAGSADILSDNFGNGTDGGVTVTAGRNITISSANGNNASIGTFGGGTVTLTTGTNGTLNLTATAGPAIFSAAGTVIANADRAVFGPLAGMGAGTAIEVLPKSGAWAIDLGSTTDVAAGTLELSDAEMDGLFSQTLRIGAVANTGDITVTGAITASVGGYGTLSLRTAGGVVDSFAGGSDFTVGSLAIRAGTGIGAAGALDTAVGTLAFTNATGAVAIFNDGTLTIGNVDGVAGFANFGTTTTIAAASPLTVAANSSSNGTLTLRAADSVATGDDLTIAAGISVVSTNGDVVLQVGDDFSSGAGSSIGAKGTITITVDAFDTDFGVGASATLNGTFTATSVLLSGGADNDTLTVDLAVNAAIALRGLAGNDTLQGGHGNDILDGGADSDTAVFRGIRANYSVFQAGADIIVTDLRAGSPDGIDTVRDVETLTFGDGSFSAAVALLQNDAPAIAGLSGDKTFATAGAAAFLDVGGNAVVQDGDSTAFANLIVRQTGGATDGTLLFGGSTVSSGGDRAIAAGESVFVGGQNVGTVFATSDGQAGRDLSIALNNASAAAVAEIFHALQYGAPSKGDRTFAATVQDSDGTLNGGADTSAAANFTISVSLNQVFRFFNTANGDHFFTTSAAEVASLPSSFVAEGSPWTTPDDQAGTVDVFRFFDQVTGTHFYTTSTVERDVVGANARFAYEGVAFEAFADAGGEGAVTIQRFFDTNTGAHHYVSDPAEAAAITAGAAGPTFVAEGAAFVVHVQATDLFV